ncbi:MAG TPA: hypothetical protein VE734_08195 [Terriglobales bacterium]|jgi:hypothetical protein|nr:hypothetical protein [Terriglobales bacterium]
MEYTFTAVYEEIPADQGGGYMVMLETTRELLGTPGSTTGHLAWEHFGKRIE